MSTFYLLKKLPRGITASIQKLLLFVDAEQYSHCEGNVEPPGGEDMEVCPQGTDD